MQKWVTLTLSSANNLVQGAAVSTGFTIASLLLPQLPALLSYSLLSSLNNVILAVVGRHLVFLSTLLKRDKVLTKPSRLTSPIHSGRQAYSLKSTMPQVALSYSPLQQHFPRPTVPGTSCSAFIWFHMTPLSLAAQNTCLLFPSECNFPTEGACFPPKNTILAKLIFLK